KEEGNMFFKKYGDIVVGVFFMVLSAALIVMAQLLPKSKVMDIGPDFMPMVIGVVTFILAAILTFMNVKNFKMRAAELEGTEIPDCDYKRVLSSIILVLIYVFTLQPVGFLIATMIFLLLQMLVLSPDDERDGKHVVRLLIIDVVFTLVVFFLFRYGFKIVLPAGIFTINL
ncbi:MAG: tripartite tricarboxylate transporter TctB family protein, partial [Eubacteriales bacterium]|nr:tripartite tricarboxylate transporter TctB family protein [Eubacteriales bacterium]